MPKLINCPTEGFNTKPSSNSSLPSLTILTASASDPIHLTGSNFVIGNSSEADLPLKHSTISPLHARLSYDNSGNYTLLQEEGSCVKVNGIDVSESSLCNGDIIRIGDMELLYCSEDSPPCGFEDDTALKVVSVLISIILAPYLLLRKIVTTK